MRRLEDGGAARVPVPSHRYRLRPCAKFAAGALGRGRAGDLGTPTRDRATRLPDPARCDERGRVAVADDLPREPEPRLSLSPIVFRDSYHQQVLSEAWRSEVSRRNVGHARYLQARGLRLPRASARARGRRFSELAV